MKNGILETALGLLENDPDTIEGVCTACGNIQSGAEPDAEGLPCESCDSLSVCGAENVVLMHG